MCDVEHVYYFVQMVRFSLCLISSIKACIQTSLGWIWSNMDRQVLHKLVECPIQLESTLPLKQKGDINKY